MKIADLYKSRMGDDHLPVVWRADNSPMYMVKRHSNKYLYDNNIRGMKYTLYRYTFPNVWKFFIENGLYERMLKP